MPTRSACWKSALSAGPAVPAVRAIRSGAQGPALIPVLAGTGMLTLVYALLLTLGLAL